MENRSKYYGLRRNGKPMERDSKTWSQDTLKARYEHIKGALDAYKNGYLNKDDIKFVIKNAFVSRIYVSEAAKKVLDGVPQGVLANLYAELVKDRVLVLHDVRNGDNKTFQPYFDICKLAEKYPNLIIEHVVPGDVYIDDVINHPFDFDYFKRIFDCISICLVTSRENETLNGLKSKMPNDSTGKSVDYKSAPFARYDPNMNGLGKGVKVFGWSFSNGTLIELMDLLCSKKGLTALFSGAIYDYFVDDGGDLLEPRFIFRRADGTSEGKEVSADELADDLLSGKKVLVFDNGDTEADNYGAWCEWMEYQCFLHLVSLQDIRTAFEELLQKDNESYYGNPVTWFEREIDFYNSDEWDHHYNYHYFAPFPILDIWHAIVCQGDPKEAEAYIQ